MFQLPFNFQSSVSSMTPRSSIAVFCAYALLAMSVRAEDAPQKITFDEHIKPIFREHCMSCHNVGDKSSGLALDTYGATLEGGSGGKIVAEGNLDGSRLWTLVNHTAQPFMPPDQDKIPEPQIALLKQWIEQGMPENSGSVIKKPKASMASLGSVIQGRPEGAPPMPEFALKQPTVFTERSAAISAIAASPWSPLVAIGGQKQVSLYHSESTELLGILPFPEGEPQSIRFSRDGQLVLVGGGRHSHSGYAVLYNLKTGERITRVGDELDVVFAADISDDNSKIALAGPQKMVRVYDTATGNLLYEQKKHTDWIYAVRFSPDGVLLATADRSNGMVVWEADTGRVYLDLVGHKNEIRSIAWRPDSSALISSSLDGTIKMWEMVNGQMIKSVDAHSGGVSAVDVCNDGTIASCGRDNKVKVWDAGLNPAGEMSPLADAGLEAAITVDGKQVVAGDWAGNVTIWNRAEPAKPIPLRANPLTLQMVIAATEALIAPAQTEATNTTAAYTASQQQVEQIQVQVKATDDALTATVAELGNVTTQLTQTRTEVEQVSKQIVDNEAVVVETKKVIEQKTAELGQKEKIAAEAAAAGQPPTPEDLNPLKAEIDALTKRVGELEAAITAAKTALQEKTTLATNLDAKMKELETKKAAEEKQKTDLAAALVPATEAANQAKQKLDAATAALAAVTTKLDLARADLARFEAYKQKIMTMDADLKTKLAAVQQQMTEADVVANAEKTNVDAMMAAIAKLQEQVTQLQQQIAAEDAKRQSAEQVLNAKKQAVGALASELESLQSQIANIEENRKAFQAAYGGN
jgi:WD40 repeat protein/predicted  nucleic acid-binding Zn-ribbon protein